MPATAEERGVMERYQFWEPFLEEEDSQEEAKDCWEDFKKSSVDCCGCDGCGNSPRDLGCGGCGSCGIGGCSCHGSDGPLYS